MGGPCGSGSVVEHLLAKEKAAGSNPVFRSRISRSLKGESGFVLSRTLQSFNHVSDRFDFRTTFNPDRALSEVYPNAVVAPLCHSYAIGQFCRRHSRLFEDEAKHVRDKR